MPLTRRMVDRFVLVKKGSINLLVVYMTRDNAKAIVFLNFGEIILSIILPKGLITPEDFLFNIIATDQRTPNNFIQSCPDTDIFFFIFHVVLLSCRCVLLRHLQIYTAFVLQMGMI